MVHKKHGFEYVPQCKYSINEGQKHADKEYTCDDRETAVAKKRRQRLESHTNILPTTYSVFMYYILPTKGTVKYTIPIHF